MPYTLPPKPPSPYVPFREPPLLECILALSSHLGLARILGNCPSTGHTHTPAQAASAAAAAAARATAAAAAATAAAGVAAGQPAGRKKRGKGAVATAGGQPEAVEAVAEASGGAGGEACVGLRQAEWAARGQGGALVRGCIAVLELKNCAEVMPASDLC